jgi:hypothetical protein
LGQKRQAKNVARLLLLLFRNEPVNVLYLYNANLQPDIDVTEFDGFYHSVRLRFLGFSIYI